MSRMQDTGKRIKAAREAKGLSQEELGLACGVTKQTIYKYEKGIVTNIPLKVMEVLAGVLRVSPIYLAGWDDEQEVHRWRRREMEIKDVIKTRRVELGMTQAQLATAVGVSEATISRWESGNIIGLKHTRLKALANALHISPFILVG